MFGPAALVGVVVLVLAVLGCVLLVRWATRPVPVDAPMPVLRITGLIAAFWAGFAVVMAGVILITSLTADAVSLTIPVDVFWPQLPTGTTIEGLTATRIGGGFTSAEVTATGLSLSVRILWGLGQALNWLLSAAVAGLVAVACNQMRRGHAFADIVIRLITITATAVVIVGCTAALMSDIGSSLAAREILQWSGASYPEIAGISDAMDAWMPQPGMTITFPLSPVAAGLALGALATIFRYGSVLQRDTAGLV